MEESLPRIPKNGDGNGGPHPIARFTASPSGGMAPLTVKFDASQSRPAVGSITDYGWDFGDGGQDDGEIVHHTFSQPGTWSVTLDVTDDSPNDGIATHVITVTEGPPIADFVYTPAKGEAPLTVTFASTSSTPHGGTITNYSWDFGNGQSGSGPNPPPKRTRPGAHMLWRLPLPATIEPSESRQQPSKFTTP